MINEEDEYLDIAEDDDTDYIYYYYGSSTTHSPLNVLDNHKSREKGLSKSDEKGLTNSDQKDLSPEDADKKLLSNLMKKTEGKK